MFLLHCHAGFLPGCDSPVERIDLQESFIVEKPGYPFAAKSCSTIEKQCTILIHHRRALLQVTRGGDVYRPRDPRLLILKKLPHIGKHCRWLPLVSLLKLLRGKRYELQGVCLLALEIAAYKEGGEEQECEFTY